MAFESLRHFRGGCPRYLKSGPLVWRLRVPTTSWVCRSTAMKMQAAVAGLSSAGLQGQFPLSAVAPLPRNIPKSDWHLHFSKCQSIGTHAARMATNTSPDEVVYPVHLQDAIKANHVNLAYIFRFDAVLDATKLRNALAELLSISDWRKVAGRLYRHNNKLEIRSPRTFSPAAPPFAYACDDRSNSSINDHSLACKLPVAGNAPYTQDVSAILFRPLVADEYPRTMEGLINTGIPQLSLKITIFNDATLVALAWPHTLMDAAGQESLLRAWSLVLAGRKDEVPPLLGATDDALDRLDELTADKDALPKPVMEPFRLSWLKLIVFMILFLFHRFWNPPQRTKIIFLPAAAIQKLKAEASGESAVGDSDLLTGWLAKTICSAYFSRPATIVNVVNGRPRFPWLDGVYIQNIVNLAYTFLPRGFQKTSLREIALQNRRQLREQLTENNFTAFFGRARRSIRAGKVPDIAFSEATGRVIMLNNLLSVPFDRAADFSPAVVRGQSGIMANYVHFVMSGHMKMLDNMYILNKDLGGNCWLFGTLSDAAWRQFDNEMARLGESKKHS